MIRNLIKKLFNLYGPEDIEKAFLSVTNAKDRDDFEWKFKKSLKKRIKIKD